MPLINVPSRRQFDSGCLDDNFRKNIAAMLGRDLPELASALRSQTKATADPGPAAFRKHGILPATGSDYALRPYS